MSQFQSFLFDTGAGEEPHLSQPSNLQESFLVIPDRVSKDSNTAVKVNDNRPALDSKNEQSGKISKHANKYELTVSLHDHSTSGENVLVDLNSVPGLKVGDFAMLYKKSSNPLPNKKDSINNADSKKLKAKKGKKRLIFQIKEMDSQLLKRLNNKFQISLCNNSLPLYLNIKKSNQLCIKKISPETYHINLIEVYIKDIYLSRGDMWILSNHIVNNYSYCYVGQNLTIFNSINLAISKIHIRDSNVYSGIIDKAKTKIVFRSKSSKLTFMIQLSSDMFHFDVNGDILYNKIINSLFPSIFQSWLDMGTNHLITVILFTSIVDDDDDQLLSCKLGETFNNSKDYYRIVVDQININHWSKIMINLRYEILKFREDIQLVRKQLLPSVKGNIVQALNLSTILMLNNVNNSTSLRHTQNHFILVTPGSGLFDIDISMFEKTVKKILKLDISIDLICLGARPIHYTPMFRYRNLNNKLIYRFPVWFNCFFWIHNSFVNSFNLMDNSDNSQKNIIKMMKNKSNKLSIDDEDMNIEYAMKCKIYELQMMGVMEYEMSGLQVPYLSSKIVDSSTKETFRFIKEYIDEYDDKVFNNSYIDVDEDRIDEVISAIFSSDEKKSQLNFSVNDNKDTNDHKKIKDKKKIAKNKSEKSPVGDGVQKANANEPADKDEHRVSKRSSKQLLSKKSLLFPLTDAKGAAAQSVVLTDDISGTTSEKLGASAYSTLMETQSKKNENSPSLQSQNHQLTALFRERDDTLSLMSSVSNTGSLRLASTDDLTLNKQKTNNSSVTQLFMRSQKESPNSSAIGTRSNTLRNISERLFQVLGNHENTKANVNEVANVNNSFTEIKDDQSVLSRKSQASRNVSKTMKGLNFTSPSYYKASPSLQDLGMKKDKSSSSSMKASNKKSGFKNHDTRFRYKMVMEQERLKIDEEKSKSESISTVMPPNGSSKKLTEPTNKIKEDLPKLKLSRVKGKGNDQEAYLGILIENPMKLHDIDLDFGSINFGKWNNTYSVTPKTQKMNEKFKNRHALEMFAVDGSLLTSPSNKFHESNNLNSNNTNQKAKENLISWRSLLCPASLPTTSNEFPDPAELKYGYSLISYEILPNSKFKDLISVKDLFKEMIYVRLMMGFQICDASSNEIIRNFEINENGSFQKNVSMLSYYLPKDFGDRDLPLNSYNPIAYLIVTDEVHRIFLDFYGNIRVRIFKQDAVQENQKHIVDAVELNSLGNNGNAKKQVEGTSNAPHKDSAYKPFVRTRYDTHYREVEFGPSTFAMTQYNWNKIDYYLAGNFDERHADFAYDEDDKINVFQIRLVIVRSSRASGKAVDNFGNDYTSEKDSALDNNSFLSKAASVNETGNYSKHFENVKNFLKFVQKDEYRGSDDYENYEHESSALTNGNKMKPMILDIDPSNKSHKPEILKIYYDDISQNMFNRTGYSFDMNCFHIKLQWLATTPKLIDDLVTKWAHACERFQLKLIEVPTYEAYKTPKINPFHSFVNIKCCYNPWDYVDEYFGNLDGPMNKYFYHNYLLQACDFYLDDGNEKFINDEYTISDSVHLTDHQNSEDNISVINVTDYNKASGEDFKYIQYIHKSGAYLAELKENGEFFLAPNNIFIARINLRKQALRKKQKENDLKGYNNNSATSNNGNNKMNDSLFSDINNGYSAIYNSERDYMNDYVNYETAKVTDEDDLFFDSQSIMINFLEKCNSSDYLKKIFSEAREAWMNKSERKIGSYNKVTDSLMENKGSSFESNLQEINAKYSAGAAENAEILSNSDLHSSKSLYNH
ncbi:GTPase-activating protein [Saccharomycopsis crataegensis]|uniref:GTPase-activating protein n=1 Tax=Saccharomycopsis crataegensis TaxID=43959 RepID=A0AAV5QQ93_9ASCO|nr:GTPase-activating protein [Saccharomycopsis crataegensis]